MLPHILHSTSRAAAVVQNQTQALRNVLQLQSSGPSSGSGSNWGNGPSSGGSKFNTGSRFHAGYNNAGRAVTQANAVTSHDGTHPQSDESEDVAPRRPLRPTPQKRQRIRSSSVSLNVSARHERGEKMGVLQTVQIHARARHAFAPVESLASAKQILLAEPLPHFGESEQAQAPLLVRRNSTSAPLSPLMSPVPTSAPLPSNPPGSTTAGKEQQPISDVVDPAAPQTVASPSIEGAGDHFLEKLASIAAQGDNKKALDFIRYTLNNHKDLKVEHFNAALDTLSHCRPPGEPLNALIKLYNSMLDASVVPNVQTYEKLIQALTTRDWEIHRAILSLDQRTKQVSLAPREETNTLEGDRARIEKLKLEDNFPSAMSLFEGILAIGGKDQLSSNTFVRLLRSCAYHNDINAAIHVFAQLESMKDMKLTPFAFQYMIFAFMNAGKIQESEEIFRSYLAACQSGRIVQYKGSNAETGRHHQIQVWNTMVEAYFRADMADKAIGLVDQMVTSSSDNKFAVDQTPVPTSSTFTTVIAGFILSGDVKSALAWFDKLLVQEKAPVNPYQGLDGKAMRPNSVAWYLMLDALAKEGMVDDLNRLYAVLQKITVEDHVTIRTVDHFIVHRANLDILHTYDNAKALETLDWLMEDLDRPPFVPMLDKSALILELALEYVKRGEFVKPISVLSGHVVDAFDFIHSKGTLMSARQHVEFQHLYVTVSDAIYVNLQETKKSMPWLAAWMLARLGQALNSKPQARFAPYLIPAYSRARYLGEINYDEFKPVDWDIILRLSAYLESNAARGNPDNLPPFVDEVGLGRVSSVLQDMASHGVEFHEFSPDVKLEVLEILDAQYGGQHGRNEFLKKLGPTYAEAAEDMDKVKYGALETALMQPAEPLLQGETTSLSNSPTYTSSTYVASDSGSVATLNSGLSINGMLSHSLHDMVTANKPKLQSAYRIFEKNLRLKMVPEPSVFAVMIQEFGRMGDLEKVREFYTLAQDVFPIMKPESQLEAWTAIENSMIIALAHSGHPDSAHVHRMRILDQGMAPSADAYGVLIQRVKDTTDDTSGAMALFNEAQERNVIPNLYLYNNIISKLSKARKADYALELFQQMKAMNIHPSSITYGTVIGACARVGDVKSAEHLFQEMTHSKNFKPRVPPYNTMMQLHTTTKPSRTSALHYYNEMKQARVPPSAHTYKLLLDTYGAIEPIDLRSMEQVFQELQDDTSVPLTGAHFASLINAYGCAAKDLEKAISVFESMSGIPRAPAPDAVVFEAIINVVVAHKRTELLPAYVTKMNEYGVHMTAYIANFLIKGYANVGDLSKAREIFMSLKNPPTGVAAPNNHAPHNPAEDSNVPIMEPVYREPSTWEAMVRAELGSGNRDAAFELLEELKKRGYPDAVYNRISGVMTDHSTIA